MIFNQFGILMITLLIYNGLQQSNCMIREFSLNNLNLEKALKLDTGFDYPDYKELCKLSEDDRMQKILTTTETKKIIGNYASDIIHTDLFCGNVYNILHYVNLKSIKIHSTKEEVNLSPSVTSHMLVTVIKVCKYFYDMPLWGIHMYIYYFELHRKNNLPNKNIMPVYEKLVYELTQSSEKYCRQKNKYSVDMSTLNNLKEYNINIDNIISVMNQRKETNKFLLDNEEYNLVSLKNIYRCDIIEKKELLKIILMDFGEQSEENFEAIYKDIFQEYIDATNYYWFDLWIKQIGKYQEKLLNIFKTVLFHLMKKYVMYLELLRKEDENYIFAHCYKVFLETSLDKVYLFDKMVSDSYTYETILNSFEAGQLTENMLNNSILLKISKIESLMNKIKPKSFKFLYENISDQEYLSSLKLHNDLYVKCGVELNDLSDKLLDQHAIYNRIGWNTNFIRMFLYIKHLNLLFNETKSKIVHSFIRYSRRSVRFNIYRSNEEMNTVTLLKL